MFDRPKFKEGTTKSLAPAPDSELPAAVAAETEVAKPAMDRETGTDEAGMAALPKPVDQPNQPTGQTGGSTQGTKQHRM